MQNHEYLGKSVPFIYMMICCGLIFIHVDGDGKQGPPSAFQQLLSFLHGCNMFVFLHYPA